MQLRPHIAIDLGTETTRALGPAGEFTCRSRTRQDGDSGEVLEVGNEAFQKPPSAGQLLARPVRSGVLADFAGGQALLSEAMKSVLSWWTLLRPDVVLASSQLASEADVRQLREAARAAGAREAYTADVAALAALGVGIDPGSNIGRLIMDCGAGSCEAAVVVRGSTVERSARPIGGEAMTASVRSLISRRTEGNVSRRQAQKALQKVGSALPKDQQEEINLTTESASTITVATNEIAASIQPQLDQMLEMIRGVMQNTPAALLTDIAETGLLLTGGLARLSHFDEFLARRLPISVQVADRPESAVVRGGWRARSFVSEYRRHIQ